MCAWLHSVEVWFPEGFAALISLEKQKANEHQELIIKTRRK
jgi:hypothetical protein